MRVVRIIIATQLVLALVAGCTGCSWVFMDTVPEGYDPSQGLKCSGTMAVVDTLVAGGFAAAAIGATAGASGLYDLPVAIIVGGLGALGTIIFTSSGITGFVWAHRCGKANKAREEWLSGNPEQRRELELQWGAGPERCSDISSCAMHHLCVAGFCSMGTICSRKSTDCPEGHSCNIEKEVCVPAIGEP